MKSSCYGIFQTEKSIEHNKPDIVVLDKKQKLCLVIDVACPSDTRIKKKEQEKIEYYNDLKYEILKCWNKEVDKVMILSIVIGALRTVTNDLRKNLDKVDLHLGVDALQKTCLLGTKMHCVLITRTHGQRMPFILVKRSLQPSLG